MLVVIARVKPDALTHRRVAAEAGMPLASTTYWFADNEPLEHAAFVIGSAPWVEAVRRPGLRPFAQQPTHAYLEPVLQVAAWAGAC